MLKLVAIAAVVIVAVPLVIAATRPDTFRVRRTAVIQAPPEAIYAEIQDFRRWTAWSPYEKMDPAMKRTHGGAPSGQGATYAWEGNGKAGAGRMVIVDAPAPRKVEIEVDFLKPFKAHNTAEFTLEPRDGATQVTWEMHGPSPYLSKVIGLFVDMDRMIGKDFEAGLANLKAIAESRPVARS